MSISYGLVDADDLFLTVSNIAAVVYSHWVLILIVNNNFEQQFEEVEWNHSWPSRYVKLSSIAVMRMRREPRIVFACHGHASWSYAWFFLSLFTLLLHVGTYHESRLCEVRVHCSENYPDEPPEVRYYLLALS